MKKHESAVAEEVSPKIEETILYGPVGTIKWFVVEKGFGAVEINDREVRFHCSDLSINKMGFVGAYDYSEVKEGAEIEVIKTEVRQGEGKEWVKKAVFGEPTINRAILSKIDKFGRPWFISERDYKGSLGGNRGYLADIPEGFDVNTMKVGEVWELRVYRASRNSSSGNNLVLLKTEEIDADQAKDYLNGLVEKKNKEKYEKWKASNNGALLNEKIRQGNSIVEALDAGVLLNNMEHFFLCIIFCFI